MRLMFTWFRLLENRLWKNRIQSNRYFASAAIAFAFACGASLGIMPCLNTVSDGIIEGNIVSVTALIVYLAAILVCESICAARSFSVAVLRSLLAVSMAFAAYVSGYLLFCVFY